MAFPRARLNQQQQLLKSHGDTFLAYPDRYVALGLICDEAWVAAQREWPTNSCHWQRHRELADVFEVPYLERIHWLNGEPMERVGRSGCERQVFRMTQTGFDYYLEHLRNWMPNGLTDPYVWRYPLA